MGYAIKVTEVKGQHYTRAKRLRQDLSLGLKELVWRQVSHDVPRCLIFLGGVVLQPITSV